VIFRNISRQHNQHLSIYYRVKFLHLLDAVLVDSFQILCSINENCRNEMTESFKYIPVRHANITIIVTAMVIIIMHIIIIITIIFFFF